MLIVSVDRPYTFIQIEMLIDSNIVFITNNNMKFKKLRKTFPLYNTVIINAELQARKNPCISCNIGKKAQHE